MCTYNVAQFIHSRKWENVKRESFEYFLVLKKKKKKSLYNTISHHHYRSNRCATPIFHESTPISFLYALCVPPPHRRCSFHEYEQRITEPYRREWKGYSVKGEEASQAGTRNAHRKRYPIRRPLCTFDVSRAEDGLSWKCIMDSIYF